ncbi:MAG: AMP-binding protein [Candidatus Omnitrophota bacterium]
MKNQRHHELGNVVLAARQSEKERTYWKNKLAGELHPGHFPFDKKPMGHVPRHRDTVPFEIDGDVFAKLTWIINGADTLLHVILCSVVKVLLHKYTGNTDMIIGTPIYKQDIAGDFVNTILILRNKLETAMSFKDFLFQVRDSLNEAVEHQNYPVEGIFYDLGLPYNREDCHLFDTVVILENIQASHYIDHVNRNILFSFLRTDGGMNGTIEYNTTLFERHTIERILTSLLFIMRQVLFNVTIPLDQVDALTEDEKKTLLRDFNGHEIQYPKEKTLQDLFEAQVETSPDRVAVVYDGQTLTYRELNRRANRLAWLLRHQRVGPNAVVGLISERSLNMIIGIWGILKSGAAYLPIDPLSPTNRLMALVRDSEPSHLVLTDKTVERHSYMAFLNQDLAHVKFIKTPPRPPIGELDMLPFPDRSLVDYEVYNRYIGQALAKNKMVLQGSRGCPFNCAFCHKIWPKKQVSRSAENIFAEMRVYYDMGVRRFAFVDDIFNLNIANTSRLFDMLIDHQLKVELFLALRGDILTPEYIDLMVRAGAVRITMSLETASERLQTLIGKKLNLDRFRKNIEYVCEKYPHVILELNTLHGIPTETPEEARMTLDFIKGLKWLHFPYVHVLKIYQNTDMEKIALRSGISKEAIIRSENLAYHELPETLPFDKTFSKNYQADFFNNYFMSKERLLRVLPFQMKILTEDEIVQKYDSYVPADIHSLDDLLAYAGIRRDELSITQCRSEEQIAIPDFNQKLRAAFPKTPPADSAQELKILLLDLSQLFTANKKMLYDIFEPPLGLMNLLSYASHRLPGKINGKIAKSRVDFNNYRELKALLDEFKPDVIGVRTLSFFKDFFHQTIGLIRQWGIQTPIIAGGPYVTSDYLTILADPNIDLMVIGEGELTFCEVIERIMANNGQLPGPEALHQIPGIVFATRSDKNQTASRPLIQMDEVMRYTPDIPDHNPPSINRPDDLSYVIFTSGSTGKPKGVKIRHQSVHNLVIGLTERIYHRYSPGAAVSLVAPYIFDASIKQIFAALVLGHTLDVVPEDARTDGARLSDFFRRHQVDIIDGTPTHLRLLREILGSGNPGFSPRHFVIGGEAFPRGLAREIGEIFNINGHACTITNVYGPTECCDVSTTYEMTLEDPHPGDILPIGKPMPNVRVYILDPDLRLVPIGMMGELCIGGDGVAAGYLNSDVLTSQKFIENPFEKGTSLYRSGDLVRWLANGHIEFVGRKDHQIKIRGFRIEPGEIEKQLLHIEHIKECMVVAKKDARGDNFLCAYIVPRHGEIALKQMTTVNPPFHFEKMIKKHSEFRLNDMALSGDMFISEALTNPGDSQPRTRSFAQHFQTLVMEKSDEIAVKSGTQSLSFHLLDAQSNRLARRIIESYDDRFQLSGEEHNRYQRQILLDRWGVECQEKLKSTTVFVAGAGGIGSQIIQQLALLGFGTLIICDDDTVELSNLNRQSMHDLSRMGMNKALSAQMTVQRINPHVTVRVRQERIKWENIDDLVEDSQIIFDCVDDLETKFILSEAAVARQIPHILSGMIEVNSFAAILHAPRTACFHCIYDRSKVDEINEMRKTVTNYRKKPFPVAAPALFVTTGFVCNEALKIVLGFENPAYDKFFVFNQMGTPRIVETEGYKQMTFAFNDHLKQTSKAQGFDWDICWSGKFVEELTIGPDPHCPLCSQKRRQQAGTRSEGTGIGHTGSPAVNNETKGHQSVASILNNDVGSILSLLGTFKSGKTYVPLNPTSPDKKLAYLVEAIGSRLILTDSENLDHALKIRDRVNKRIPVINIDEVGDEDDGLTEIPDIDISPDSEAYLFPQFNTRSQDVPLTPSGLREFLLKELPDYMIPNYFMEIETFPLTANGKLDIDALPEPRIGQPDENHEVPRNPVEKKLAEIWSDVLSVNGDLIGINSHFFDLGGHSLRATSLIAKINKEFNVKVPLVEVFRTPTIKGLAQFISNSQRENASVSDDAHLVRLNVRPGESGNLFFIHEISGGVDGYMEFVLHLDVNLNCWGIRAAWDDYPAPKNQTIEEMATRYIETMKMVQPRGPYFLVGWSLGGSIAFEMVRQLEQSNEPIGFVSLIDSVGPRGAFQKDALPFTSESEKAFVRRAISDPELHEKLESASGLDQIWSVIGEYLEKTPAGMDILKEEIRKNTNPGMGIDGQIKPMDMIKRFNMARTLANAWSLYNPAEKIKTPIHYVAAVRSKETIKDKWEDYSEQPILHYEIDGDHFSIFRKPDVLAFAEKFCNMVRTVIS